ncbi:hypothetical protein IQ273_12825 [Nodosilinea sp. LEGE 07298]|uniref:hypothetical protein n=1 Tax=Nodosilinea sp. LEGE 07298 TaxID=2777970 RepID=UPI0018822432|nr:hypothetical protein [Nodosilinea sp. LEGE 07298]MBE9110296.1 hypothetical protein [Nodosilinea sp. LEGE 07298]
MSIVIDYDSLPPRFNNECRSAIETVHQEIQDSTDDWWFELKHVTYYRSELVAYINWDHPRAEDISNSPVLRSRVARHLLQNCPIDRFSMYSYDGYETEYDIWLGYKLVNGALLNLSICETETYPVFCEDI